MTSTMTAMMSAMMAMVLVFMAFPSGHVGAPSGALAVAGVPAARIG
jgi:hypothetical protein